MTTAKQNKPTNNTKADKVSGSQLETEISVQDVDPLSSPNFSYEELSAAFGAEGRQTHLPKHVTDAFLAKGYELQYANYSNMNEWLQRIAATNGAIAPVTLTEIEQYCGEGTSMGMVAAQTFIGGKAVNGVVRAGEMVLLRIPVAVAEFIRRKNNERTQAARREIYGQVNMRGPSTRFEKHTTDGTLVQTVTRGPNTPSFGGDAYLGGFSE